MLLYRYIKPDLDIHVFAIVVLYFFLFFFLANKHCSKSKIIPIYIYIIKSRMKVINMHAYEYASMYCRSQDLSGGI
jgi:hypothetical protein